MLALELHAHTHASEDSLVRPVDIVRVCQRRGIDRIAITDHNVIGGAREAQALAPELVIVGEEIMTTQGELLAYFVREEVPPRLEPLETIARLRAQGAAISVSHPFDRYRGGAWREQDLRAIAHLVDAIEVFNARCVHAEDNARALAFARELGLAGSVGSDAHTLRELGRARLMAAAADTAADLIAAFRAGQVTTRLSSPAIHLASRGAKLWRTATRLLGRNRKEKE
jgi:predicted metal-dependent phosphoesterase TrpH